MLNHYVLSACTEIKTANYHRVPSSVLSTIPFITQILLHMPTIPCYLLRRSIFLLENSLNKDINNLSTWFCDNELIINLKKGKTSHFCSRPILIRQIQKLLEESTLSDASINPKIATETIYRTMIIQVFIYYSSAFFGWSESKQLKIRDIERCNINIITECAQNNYKLL